MGARRILVAAATALSDHHVEILLYPGAGADGGSTIYLGGAAQADYSDLRASLGDGTPLACWVHSSRDGLSARMVVLVPAIPASPDSVAVDVSWGSAPAGSIIRLGLVGDPHHAPADWAVGPGFTSYRSQVVPWLTRFRTRMGTFAPDLISVLGDMSTATGAPDKTSLLTAVIDEMDLATAPVAPVVGNHDFEYATPADVRTALARYTYWQTGKLYGSFDVGDFHVAVLDGCYATASPFAHNSASGGIGPGYIPDGTAGSDDELGWLTADLAATTKPTIILVHQSLDEFDASTFYSAPATDFERFAIENRAAVRAVLEASGKVAAVFEGHQHFWRTSMISGIAYLQTPSFCDVMPYPSRLTATDRGRWAEATLDTSRKRIVYDLWEDDSTLGAVKVATQTLHYAAGATRPPDPFVAFAAGNTAGIGASSTGAPSFDGGDVTQWTVVTDTTTYVPVDMLLAQARADEPNRSGGGALILRGGSTAKAGTATRRIAAQAGRFRLALSLYLAQTNRRFEVTLRSSAGVAGPSLAFDAAGDLVTAAGATLAAYSAGEWHDLDLLVDVGADTYAVLLDGVQVGSGLAFASSLAEIDRLTLAWPAGANGTAYLDDVALRSWADPEATITAAWAFGAPALDASAEMPAPSLWLRGWDAIPFARVWGGGARWQVYDADLARFRIVPIKRLH